MIDIEKEYEAFEAYMNRDECEKDDVFTAESNGWVARAMFENEEIKNLTSKHGSAIGKLHFTEKKLGEAQQEISELKAKLAKYESRDVVVLPRIPSNEMVEAMGYAVCNMGGDCWFDTDEAYKAMIEKGEVK